MPTIRIEPPTSGPDVGRGFVASNRTYPSRAPIGRTRNALPLAVLPAQV